LEIENFKFAIVTEGGALWRSIGNATGAAEQTEKEKICRKGATMTVLDLTKAEAFV
jgi:hypothetical protein